MSILYPYNTLAFLPVMLSYGTRHWETCEQGKHSSCSFLQSFYFRKREKHKITNINSLVLIMIHTTKAKEKVGGKEMAELGT